MPDGFTISVSVKSLILFGTAYSMLIFVHSKLRTLSQNKTET